MIRDLLILTGLTLGVAAIIGLLFYFLTQAIKEAIGRGLNL